MARGMSNEIKSGLFILACLAILALITFSIGTFTGLEKTYQLNTTFNWVSGIEKNAPVRLSGVDVGEVTGVEIKYDDDETKILLTLTLKESAKIREDSKAYVSTLGLMGEKYIELTGGSKGSPFLKPGSIIIGEDPLQMEEVIKMAKRLAEEAEGTMQDTRKLAQDLDTLVVDNKGNVDGMIDDLKATANNFKEFSADIKQNPWKLLVKAPEKSDDIRKRK